MLLALSFWPPLCIWRDFQGLERREMMIRRLLVFLCLVCVQVDTSPEPYPALWFDFAHHSSGSTLLTIPRTIPSAVEEEPSRALSRKNHSERCRGRTIPSGVEGQGGEKSEAQYSAQGTSGFSPGGLHLFGLDWIAIHQRSDETKIVEAVSLARSHRDSPDMLYLLGLVYLNNYKIDEAGDVFRKMLAKSPELIEARWGLAEVLRRKKEIEKSEKMLNVIIRQDPDFSPAVITLAYLRYTQTRFNEAVKLSLKVQRQGRERVDLSNLVRAYCIYAGAKGMIASNGGPLSKVINGTQVLPNLKKAEKLQPHSPAVLFGLGSFHFLAPGIIGGNLDKAIEYLKKAIEVDPLFADSYVRLAQVYKARGDRKSYNEYMSRALEIDPENDLARDEESGVCKFNCVTAEE